MERFLVTGGARLAGTVQVAGAKNSVLKLMAAALLAEGTTVISNCPEILDVPLMADVLRGLGATVDLAGDTVIDHHAGRTVLSRGLPGGRSAARLGLRARPADGSLPAGAGGAARRRRDRVPAAGHAPIRPAGDGRHDEHRTRQGGRPAQTGCTARRIGLDFPSVGATENILMAAVLADGTTVIDNAAREPEIIDLAGAARQMGAQIDGVGTATVTIDGVDAAAPGHAPHRRRPGGRRDLGLCRGHHPRVGPGRGGRTRPS